MRWVGLNSTVGSWFVLVDRGLNCWAERVLDRWSEIGSDFVFLARLPEFFSATLSLLCQVVPTLFFLLFPLFSSLLLPVIPFMVFVRFVRA